MSVVRGSGVEVVLHNCSRFDVVGRGRLGSSTRLLDRGSSSESLSSGSVNHPRRWAVFVLGLASKDGARVHWLAKPVL